MKISLLTNEENPRKSEKLKEIIKNRHRAKEEIKMIKKLAAILLTSIMVLSGTVMSFAEENEAIILNSQDEITNYIDSSKEDQSFFIPDNNGSDTRAICYMCGRPNLGTGKWSNQSASEVMTCPGDGIGNGDFFMTYEVFRVERCTSCGYQVVLKYLYDEWYMECNAMTGGLENTKYNIIIGGCPLCDGYNVHECIDPDDPRTNPFVRHYNEH